MLEARLLERARVTGVLDAWMLGGRRIVELDGNEHAVTCELVFYGGPRGGRTSRSFRGPTPDAARALAAQAIEAGEI